jgi:hypothetical protein
MAHLDLDPDITGSPAAGATGGNGDILGCGASQTQIAARGGRIGQIGEIAGALATGIDRIALRGGRRTAASKALLACVAAVPSPRLVRAAAASVRSERLLAITRHASALFSTALRSSSISSAF